MSFTEISPAQAKQMFEEQNAVFVDVREPIEHASKRIKDSRLHPVGSIQTNNIEAHQAPLLIYCQKGVRGKKACEKLAAKHPELMLFNISGGIENWEKCGFSTEAGQSKVLPLDRQVQIAIGVLIVFFCALSVFISTAFVYAVALVGVGLIFAGVSGFCGMARVIAMMPWNQRI